MRAAFAVSAITVALAGCLASTQQEAQMGASYSQQINATLPLIQDAEVNRYINVLGDSIARLADNQGREWHFYVVDAKDVNAFAVPGGYIYVNRGLIERFEKMDQLASVLGHEIAHVTQRHSIKQQAKAQRASAGIGIGCVLLRVCSDPTTGSLVNLGAGALMAGFSRDDEAEADRYGIDNVLRAGIDPHGMIETFEILMAERKTKPEGLDAFFQTHPLEENRIQQARNIIGSLPPAQREGLAVDSPNFRAFKARVKSLPPSPGAKRG